MKKLIIATLSLIVSASAFAQQNGNSTKNVPPKTLPVAVKDTTTFHIAIDQSKLQILFQSLEGFAQLIKRSPDVTALQAYEASKGVATLANDIYQQIKPQLPPEPAAHKTEQGPDPKNK